MNQNIIDFYQVLRSDAKLVETLMKHEGTDELLEAATSEAKKLGFHFTKEEALTAGMNIDALRAESANDEELSDFELELISAGTQIKNNGDVDRV